MLAIDWNFWLIGFMLMILPVLGVNICSLKKLPVHLGDSGVVSYESSPPSSIHHCALEVTACDNCRLNINMTRIEFPSCRRGQPEVEHPTKLYAKCHGTCPMLMVHEPAYSDVSTSYHYQPGGQYASLSSTVILTLCNVQSLTNQPDVAVQINYNAEEKIQLITGRSHPSTGGAPNSNSFLQSPPEGVMTSPNFPRGYAAGETYKYVLANLNPRGFIRLAFIDWDLAPSSRIKFYYNADCLSEPDAVHYGSHFRPLIQTTGRHLCVLFIARESFSHRTSHMGFSAKYWFTEESSWPDPPITGCGVYYRYISGGVLQFRPSKNTEGNLLYDCTWVIFPHSAYQSVQLNFKSIVLRNPNVSLKLYQGHTSPIQLPKTAGLSGTNSPFTFTPVLKDTVIGPVSYKDVSDDQYVYHSNNGFYVHLYGSIQENDTIQAIFTSYTESKSGSCAHTSDFMCVTKLHCIDRHLLCDGVTHCVDHSDEDQDCATTASNSLVFWMECGQNEFQCVGSSKECVPMSSLCDGWMDCLDNSDEENCPEEGDLDDIEYLTGNVSGSSPIRGDTFVNRDRKNHGECESRGMRACASGDQCIHLQDICDGKHQCWDRSDEIDCILSLPHSNPGMRTLDILIPAGIAICLALSFCTIVLCIRTRHKLYTMPPTRRNSSVVRRSRTIRSVTSETPLTSDLSRTPSLMAERYEGAWLHTPTAYHDVELSPGHPGSHWGSSVGTPPHSATASAASSHLSAAYYGPGAAAAGGCVKASSPCEKCGSPLPPSLQASPNKQATETKDDKGKPQVFLFPDVPAASSDASTSEDPLRVAAREAAANLPTCSNCHQRLQYAESLPTSLIGAGESRKFSASLSPDAATDEVSSIRTASPVKGSSVNLARTWDPRVFHAMQPQLAAALSGSQHSPGPHLHGSCHHSSCMCSTHSRHHRRRSTTRIRPNRQRYLQRCHPMTYGSNCKSCCNHSNPLHKQTFHNRHSSFHGMPSTAINSNPACERVQRSPLTVENSEAESKPGTEEQKDCINVSPKVIFEDEPSITTTKV